MAPRRIRVNPSTKPWSPRANSASKARMGAASMPTSDMVAHDQRAVGQWSQGKRWTVMSDPPHKNGPALCGLQQCFDPGTCHRDGVSCLQAAGDTGRVFLVVRIL